MISQVDALFVAKLIVNPDIRLTKIDLICNYSVRYRIFSRLNFVSIDFLTDTACSFLRDFEVFKHTN